MTAQTQIKNKAISHHRLH